MDFLQLVRNNRTCRRFYEEESVSEQQLRDLVELARLSPSGANLQPMKFFLSADPVTNDTIFPHLRWAAYLDDWDGPEKGERPAAYILMLRDTEIKNLTSATDAGVYIQSILLGARSRGLGGCIFASADKEAILDGLKIDRSRYEFMYLLGLGVPKEEVILEDVEEAGTNADIRYYRDREGRHHVPKRRLDDIIIS